MNNKSEISMSEQKPLTFWEVLGSTFAALLGVQSQANKVRDFTRGNAVHFFLSGLIFTIALVAGFVLLVQAVLP